MNPQPFFKEQIFKTLWEMKKDHYAKFTIEVTDRRLRPITKSVNLDNPNEITDI